MSHVRPTDSSAPTLPACIRRVQFGTVAEENACSHERGQAFPVRGLFAETINGVFE